MENNILQTLTDQQKSLIVVKSFNKKEIIYREGDLCENISIVISGEIKISSFSFEGNELIYNILKKNEIFGNNLIFSDDPYYKGDVICLKESVVVFINRANLISLLQSNKEFMISYLKIQSNFSKKLNSTIKMLSYSSLEERFKYYLFINKNSIVYSSVTDLASIIHVQRESLSRLLTKLEKENVIKRSPHKIELVN